MPPIRLWALSLISLTSPLLGQTTWYVDSAVPGPGSGSSIDPFARIDFAVAQSAVLPGDTVLVLPGDYPQEQINFAGKGITVESTDGPGVTRILGNALAPQFSDPQPLVQFTNQETRSAVLRGFTIDHSEDVLSDPGSPVLCVGSSPTIENCTFGVMFNYCWGDQAGQPVHLGRKPTRPRLRVSRFSRVRRCAVRLCNIRQFHLEWGHSIRVACGLKSSGHDFLHLFRFRL